MSGQDPVTCRFCRCTEGTIVMDMGRQPACDHFPSLDDVTEDPVYPLRLWLCSGCRLAQLAEDPTVPDEPRGVEPLALVRQAEQAVSGVGDAGLLPASGIAIEHGSPHGGTSDVDLMRHDMREPLPVDMAGFAYVVHAAGIASPTYYRAHPIETMDANITGLRNLLEYARKRLAVGQEFGGFLFFSSSEIYGDPDPAAIPTPETYRGFVSCTGPRACYDESKRYGETLCVNFAQQYGVPARMARPFNNYGPGMKITDGRVIADLCRDALAGRDLTLRSDGSPRRTFCYVSDAVTGYYLALLRGASGEPYNIGIDRPEITMFELAETIARLTGEVFCADLAVTHRPSVESAYLVDNPGRRCPDIGKARAHLGYRPKVALDEGLRRTLLWYAGNLGGTEQ